MRKQISQNIKGIMRNNLIFVIIHCLITTFACNAMKQKLNFKEVVSPELDLYEIIFCKKPNIISEISIIKKPLQAEYLSKNRIIILGIDECCIINPKTHEITKKIETQSLNFAIDPIQKLIAFTGTNVAIYNKSGDFKTSIKPKNQYPITKLAFGPLQDSILLEQDTGSNWRNSKSYNYKTKTINACMSDISHVAYHPTHNFYYKSGDGCSDNNEIEIYNLTTLNKTGAIDFSSQSSISSILCSPNGKLLAVEKENKIIYIINRSKVSANGCTTCDAQRRNYIILPIITKPFSINLTTFIEPNNNDEPVIMLFHPNSAVLTTTTSLYIDHNLHHIVFYWDVKTKELITTMPPLPLPTGNRYDNKNIAFSPDGTKLITVLPDKCLILSVPFEVLYDATKKLPHLYWFLLKNRCNQHNIPKDVQKIIALYLLELKFKR